MESVTDTTDRGIGAIDCQGILGQIVRTDAHEVDETGHMVGKDRQGRHFDHHPDLEPIQDGLILSAQLGTNFGDKPTQPVDFLQTCDHGKHDLDRVAWANAPDGSYLSAQELRLTPCQAHPADAEGWVLLWWLT